MKPIISKHSKGKSVENNIQRNHPGIKKLNVRNLVPKQEKD